MTTIKKLLTGTCILTMFVIAGCGSGNSSTQNDSIDENQTQQNGTFETESIAGLPQQNDSVKPSKQYTTYTFASAEDAVEFMQRSSDWEKYQEGILPQVAHEELKYATKLLNSPYNNFIVVDKDKMKVILFDKYGRLKKQYPMAGPKNFGTKHTKGDSRTPEGYFSAEGVYNSTDWEFTDDDGVKHPGKCFGPRFIRVKNPITTQVGIHGTSSPSSIGKRTSHGCIRLTDQNILDLVKYVERGMPIIILPSSRDRAVNESEGYVTGYFNTGVERYEKNPPIAHNPRSIKDSITDSQSNQETPVIIEQTNESSEPKEESSSEI